jgi:hypothetical protein
MSKRNRLLGRLQDLIKKRDRLNTDEDKGDQSLIGKYIKVSGIIGDSYILVKSQIYGNFEGTDFIKVKGLTLCCGDSEKIGEGVYICFVNDDTTYITDPKKIEVVSKEHFITALQGYLNWAQENQELIINTLLPNE